MSQRYQAVGEEGIIANALFLAERDFKTFLDQNYPIEAALSPHDPQYLEDFQERALGQIFRNVFPCLALGPNRNATTESDARDRLKQAVRFDCYIGVTADSAANVTTKIMRYTNTLASVFISALKSDWSRNMSVQTFGVVLDSLEHVYGPIRERESIYYRDALLESTLLFNER